MVSPSHPSDFIFDILQNIQFHFCLPAICFVDSAVVASHCAFERFSANNKNKPNYDVYPCVVIENDNEKSISISAVSKVNKYFFLFKKIGFKK